MKLSMSFSALEIRTSNSLQSIRETLRIFSSSVWLNNRLATYSFFHSYFQIAQYWTILIILSTGAYYSTRKLRVVTYRQNFAILANEYTRYRLRRLYKATQCGGLIVVYKGWCVKERHLFVLKTLLERIFLLNPAAPVRQIWRIRTFKDAELCTGLR